MTSWRDPERHHRRLVLLGVSGGATALALTGAWVLTTQSPLPANGGEENSKLHTNAVPGTASLRDLATEYVVSPSALIAADPDRAREMNAEIPLKAVGEAARPFKIVPAEARIVATGCLARAVYYEARSEPLSGQRAVAQVVLNRARHPAYPSTICGVVYQGSDRTTGCQFTFTCDGSQAIKPSGPRWNQAMSVAQRALDGFVERDVGWATHYHADYVLPYWASKLDKMATIGRHIFYRWSMGWGTSAAFTQRYSAAEMDPMAGVVTPTPTMVVDVSALSVPPVPLPRTSVPLRADDGEKIVGGNRTKLIVDDGAPVLREDLQGKPLIAADSARMR